MSGQWVRRGDRDPTRSVHVCQPPVGSGETTDMPRITVAQSGLHQVRAALPPARPIALPPDGQLGDLWRCDCGKLWRVAYRCDECDWFGYMNRHQASLFHRNGLQWRRAKLAQRIRHWRSNPKALNY